MAELNIGLEKFETEVLQSSIPVLVDFWAPWCGPCKMIGPVVEEIAKEYDSRLKVCKVNVDEEQELAIKYGVASIPTLLLFKNGEIVKSSLGFHSKREISAMVNEVL